MNATLAEPPLTIDAEAVAQHQDELRRQGYTVFRACIAPAVLSAMRASIDANISRRQQAENQDLHHGVNLVAWDEAFTETACHPLILATVEGLLGNDCILSSCNLGARIPGCPAQSLHRDTGIWGESMPFMPFPVGIQTAWCIDDFTSENGSTRLIPGSHRDPVPCDDARAITITAPAGSIVAFDCQAFHAGGANGSPRLRRAVLTLYIRSWLKPQTDHKRSYPRERLAAASPELLRLLGFRRQSPVELPGERSEVVMAPGATSFYDQPPQATATY
jgi:hypothetical protein